MLHQVNPPVALDGLTRFLHAGIMIFGILAWLTGLSSGDYKHLQATWFPVHKWLGMGLTVFLGLRLGYGLWGPEPQRFTAWVPYTPARFALVWADIRLLLNRKLPQRDPRQGLASLWEALGLAIFTWMAATGTYMFLFLPGGQKVRGFLHLIKELHEIGEWLIPVFLAVHVGAVIFHAWAGDHRWRRMFFLD